MIRKGIFMPPESETLRDIGALLRNARLAHAMTQEEVAALAGISRPRYRDIETGTAAARATTLINVARALGLEMLLVPQAMVPAVQALLQPQADDDMPAFVSQPDDADHG
ncbi:MAG: helix-turn-helix domain-containing protein [Rhizobium sp.]|nr:helix-turn-helix domain-containing protein [Rhizobium sp.]